MALGDQWLEGAIRTAGWMSDDPSYQAAGNFVGNLLSAHNSQADMDAANAETEQQRAIIGAIMMQQAQVAQANAQRQQAVGDAIYSNTATQQQVMQGAFNALGAPTVIDEAAINARYGDLNNQYQQDVLDAAAFTNSQGYANNLAKGMGDSSIEGDRKYVAATQLAKAMSAARNQAYADAISQMGGLDNTLAANRGNIMKSYGDLYNVPLANQLTYYKAMPDSANAYYSAGITGNNLLNQTQEWGTQAGKSAGDGWATFNTQTPKQMAALFGYRLPEDEDAIAAQTINGGATI